MAMSVALREVLSGIRTVEEMVEAFRDEGRCRRLLEAMVWPQGRTCPACGYKRSIALAGRDMGRHRARPGLYQCSNGTCRFQFTVTTRAAARDQAAAEHVAEGAVADPAIGQGDRVGSPGRGARRQSADGVAHRPCAAPDAGAGDPARRHSRDR